MRADDPNLPYLRSIAQALGELREQVVFVGGAVAGLLVTTEAMVAELPREAAPPMMPPGGGGMGGMGGMGF